MANFGSAAAKSDGIACLLRRFETHIDTGGVFTRLPDKAYRAGSIRGQRDVHKIIDLPALEPISQSHPFIPAPNGSQSIVKSSSKSTESPVLSSPTSAVDPSKIVSAVEVKLNDRGETSSQQAATGDETAVHSVNSTDDHEPDRSLASSSSAPTGSSSDPSKDSISTPPRSSEANLPRAIENHGPSVHQFPSSSEGGSAASRVPIGSSKNSRSMDELDAAERKAAKGREAGNAVATRFIFKQSSRENQNATVYLDDASSSSSSLPSTSNKVKQLARSMDNICSNSAASTPTKERNVFHVDKSAPRVGKWNADNSSPSTAPAAIPSLANDEEKAAVARAKKPPPVPKKNSKVGREAEGRELNSVSGDQSDAKPPTGESQTMPNLSQTKKPAARPTTLFPDLQVADNDDGGGGGGGGSSSGDEVDDDDARHKSLPILGSSKDVGAGRDEPRLLPTNDPKNTLFPCNRQKTRTRILSTETNSTDDQGSLPYSPFVTSPMSLGTRTPPDIDSIVDNKTNFSDKKYSSEQKSTTAGNAFTRSRSSDQLLSVESAAAAATKTDDVFDSHEAFDPDSFLSDAFDFLGSSNSAEIETKTSPLKSWTDTWCKASQKRLSKASDRFAEVAGSSSMEYRTTEGDRKEPTGNLPDKTKQQDETTAKITSTGMNHLNAGLNKTSNAPMKATGRGEKTKTGDDADPPPPTTHFGVVLRRTDAPSSLFRRSSIASLVSNENPSALTKKTNARRESFVSRPVTIGKSTESFRTSDRTSVNLNRKPSMVSAGTSALPLTAAVPPSQKPTHKPLFGRNIVGRASSTLNRSSVVDSNGAAEVAAVGARGARQSTSGNKLESELNDIDRAFMFLDRS